jgi:hypothetical protein
MALAVALAEMLGVVPGYWEQITMVGVDNNGHPFPLDSISAVVGNSFSATFLANGTPFPIPRVFRQN